MMPQVRGRRKNMKEAPTLAGNYQLFARMPELLTPWCNPIFVQLISHKLDRLLVPYCLAALLVANLSLPYGLYRVFSLCQVLFYCLACVGGLISTYRGGISSGRLAPQCECG